MALESSRVRLTIVALAVAMVGCSTFTVQTDQRPEADFTRYKTFAWFPIAAVPPLDQTTGDRSLDQRIYETIEREIQQKGYAYATSDTSDLLLTFRLVRNDSSQEPSLPYGQRWRRGAYLDAAHASTDIAERGTLVIDVVDRASNELAWRGLASARLQLHTSYETSVKRAREAIEQTLATFPAR